MPTTEEEQRIALRREAYDLKDKLILLYAKLTKVDPAAAASINQARSATFEAWTILCVPPEDDDDDHEH